MTLHINDRPLTSLPSLWTPAASYSELPADWRAPLEKVNPTGDMESQVDTQKAGEEEGGGEGQGTRELSEVRTSAQVLEEATQVTGSGVGTRRAYRKPDQPPEVGKFQTNSQRRRNLPLSQLKRVKPKRRR